MASVDRWDVFCRVVDHFGDVGIGWRVARQLAASSRRSVRLFVDGLAVLAAIEPRVDPSGGATIDGVEVAPWPADDVQPVPADVVVELLGCRLPPGYLAAMAARGPDAPVWIDYEHLSAEAWVDDFHGLPSPHPTLPLVKHFFYPGFGPRTGGLPIEPERCAGRSTTLPRDADAAPVGRARHASLFAYRSAPVDALAAALATDGRYDWTLVVPAGAPAPSNASGVRVVAVPFTDQAAYDRLLATCDVNFVRGEDSFVRAQLAGKPMVWQAYVQPDAAHLPKVAAFEARYAAAIAPDGAAARDAQRALWDAWNRADMPAVAAAVPAWIDALPVLDAAARAWRERLCAGPPLVERLVAFADAVRPGRRAARSSGP